VENIDVPYRIETRIETYEGDWTSEDIASGRAGEPKVQTQEQWYEPTPDGPQLIEDENRINELRKRLR
jgi:hypothetical protein